MHEFFGTLEDLEEVFIYIPLSFGCWTLIYFDPKPISAWSCIMSCGYVVENRDASGDTTGYMPENSEGNPTHSNSNRCIDLPLLIVGVP